MCVNLVGLATDSRTSKQNSKIRNLTLEGTNPSKQTVKKRKCNLSAAQIVKHHVVYHVLHVCGDRATPFAFEVNQGSWKLRSRG